MNKEKCDICIVDRDVLVAELLKKSFEEQEFFQIKEIFTDSKIFIDSLMSGKLTIDLLIIELHQMTLPLEEVMALLHSKFPKIKVIVLTSNYKSQYVGAVFKMGVNAFVSKNNHFENLCHVILDVCRNDFSIQSDQLDAITMQISPKNAIKIFDDTERLSERELEVLDLICQQNTTNEIAEKLFITKRTVEGHRSNLLLKTRTKNSVGLVIWAMQNKIFDFETYLV
jgi:DNA-binding NarL/FixJ family response regulator